MDLRRGWPQLRTAAISFVCTLLSLFFRLFVREKGLPGDIRAIVIIKPCCLGDVLMATPALKALRVAHPKARIAWAISQWARPALENNPHLSDVIDSGPVGAGRRYGLSDYLALARRLRLGKFDLAIVLDRSPLLALLPLLAGIPHRAGLDSWGRGFSLTIKVPCDGLKHEVDLYLDVVRACGIQAVDHRLEYYPTAQDRAQASHLLAPLRKHNAPLVIIHPGGGANPGMVLEAKRWPVERFSEVAQRLVEEWNAVVIVVGGESDAAIARRLTIRGGPSFGRIVDMAGQLSLGQLAAVCEVADLYIGNDSGPLHLATAVGMPVVAVFGPSDPRQYGPRGENCRVVSRLAPWGPCFRDGYAISCADCQCIAKIATDEVWQAVEGQLHRRLRVKHGLETPSSSSPS